MASKLPTSTSHGISTDSAANKFNVLIVEAYNRCETDRTLMAAGVVGDDVILRLWDRLANIESEIKEIRRLPDFHDKYADYRGLQFQFNCTDDVNAATDKITNLPANHKFITDTRVDFTILEGALPGGLSEGTNYFIRTVDASGGTVTLTTTEGGGTDINLSNGIGVAFMTLNIKPDLADLLTALDAALDEIELNLTQRAVTYDRVNLEVDYSTRDTTSTGTLRTKLQDIEDLINMTEVT